MFDCLNCMPEDDDDGPRRLLPIDFDVAAALARAGNETGVRAPEPQPTVSMPVPMLLDVVLALHAMEPRHVSAALSPNDPPRRPNAAER